jgi:hypothetical protein
MWTEVIRGFITQRILASMPVVHENIVHDAASGSSHQKGRLMISLKQKGELVEISLLLPIVNGEDSHFRTAGTSNIDLKSYGFHITVTRRALVEFMSDMHSAYAKLINAADEKPLQEEMKSA